MSKTFDFYEALGVRPDLEREFGNKGAGSLYWSIKSFAMAHALAEKAGLQVKKVPTQDVIPDVFRDEWPSYLQPAAGALEDDVQFVDDLIFNIVDDEAEQKRLKSALKDAIREDFKAAVAEAEQVVENAAA